MSFALVQAVPASQSGTNTSTTITVTAVGAGHLLVIINYVGSLTKPITSITGGETWVDPGKFADNTGGGGSLDMRYVLAATGGETSFVPHYASDTNWQGAMFYEFSYSAAATCALDDAEIRQPGNVNESTPVPGVALTIGGTNDVLIQAALLNTDPTAIDSSYTIGGVRFGSAAAYLVNSVTGTAPNWTALSENYGDFYAVSFKEVTGVKYPRLERGTRGLTRGITDGIAMRPRRRDGLWLPQAPVGFARRDDGLCLPQPAN